jgi:hypothetical protein
MSKSPYAGWVGASMDAWTLGMEASTVIGLRVAKLAMGGAGADAEGQRMVAEKLQAAWELQAAMMFGQMGATPLAGTRKVIRHYRKKVKANRKRLA